MNYLPAWFSSGLDVRLVLSEELFSNPYDVAKRLVNLARIPFNTIGHRLEDTLKHATVMNAKAKGPIAHMPKEIERSLNRFYHTYNQKLKSIYLHGNPRW